MVSVYPESAAQSHAPIIRLDVALRLRGERTFARDVARDLRCSHCGKCEASVQTISDSRLPDTIKGDPDGGFLVGPQYPIIDPPLSPAALTLRRRGWNPLTRML